jgi:hypothetical protein
MQWKNKNTLLAGQDNVLKGALTVKYYSVVKGATSLKRVATIKFFLFIPLQAC